MSVTIIVEITNKLHTQRVPQQHHNRCIYGQTHTICDFDQLYELNEF